MVPLRSPLAVACTALIALWPGHAVAASSNASAAQDSVAGDADLSPTTAIPWNPSAPVHVERPWETALRFPGRLVSLPLSALDYVLSSSLRHTEGLNLIPKLQILTTGLSDVGISVFPASLGDRTGLGGGVRLNPAFTRDLLVAEVSGSTLSYNRTRLEVFHGPARLAYLYDWRPRDRFFGVGLGVSNANASTYAARTQHVLFSLLYPWQRPRGPAPKTQLGAWAGPREMILRTGRDKPSFNVLFQGIPQIAGQLDDRREYFTYGVRAFRDTRSGQPHWTRGWRAEASAERFDKAIKALAIRDPNTGAPPFTRFSLAGETGFSFMRDPHSLRLAMRAVNQRLQSGSDTPLIPDFMSLGGREGLAGFEPGRFHDVDLAVAKLSYVAPLIRYLELDLHAEAGGVYPELSRARLSSAKHSFGVAFRPRLYTRPLGWIGVDWSKETTRVGFALGGVE